MIEAIRTKGSVSVAIYASSQAFSYYKSGVYYDPNGCSGMRVDHAVNAVGYGTLNGMDYYIVRNSWGTWWGMNGYILMARNQASHCGIADWAAYPII
jgi:C1A family cysteine protease